MRRIFDMSLPVCRRVMIALALLTLSLPLPLAGSRAQTGDSGFERRALDIYFIDVEGGAATLIVSPAAESLLIDSGFPGERDAGRIVAVARKQAGLNQIDHYITTHWHTDHVGGIAQVSKHIPVKRYYGHGIPNPLPKDINPDLIQAYRGAAGGDGVILKAGDEIRLIHTRPMMMLQFRILAANGVVPGEPPGAHQIRECRFNHQAAPKDESDNANSIGFLLRYGDFAFFDGGDLTWNVEHKLACPANIPGPVDVFQVNHHGADTSNNPVLVEALTPRVAIINNGPKKGGGVRTYATLKKTRSIESIFQLHRNVQTGEQDNAPPAMVANDNEACEGNFIKLSVDFSGRSYTVSIPAKGVSRKYHTR